MRLLYLGAWFACREYLRRSLDLTSWQAAQDFVRGWEASGEVGVVNAEIPSLAEAARKFFEDAAARQLKPATLGTHKLLLEQRLLPWCNHKDYRPLKQLDRPCPARVPRDLAGWTALGPEEPRAPAAVKAPELPAKSPPASLATRAFRWV
jgi:hypothetical protein